MKRLTTLALVLCLAILSRGNDTTRPWTFWYWMYGAVSEAGIKADLQAMKDVGLGGCYLMPIRGSQERPEYQGTADALSDNFWRMVDYSFAQADSLFCDTVVTGGKHHFLMQKPQHYDNYYEDIAAYAIPVTVPLGSPKGSLSYSPEITINAKGVLCADEPCWIQYEFDKPTLVRNVEIEPSGTNIQCQRLTVKISHDGVIFQTVKQLTPPRQGWQNTDFNTTFSIPPCKVKYVRLEWTPEGTEPGAEDLDAAKWKPVLRLKGIKFGSWPLIDNWEGKAGYVWRIAPETPDIDLPYEDFLHPRDIKPFKMQGDYADVELPEGTWRILRMGHTSTGHTNATAGGAKGLECDKFSRKAVSKQVDRWFGLFMNRPNHKVVKYLHVDSWECGSQNWSQDFATLRDIRKTINELVNEVFFVTVAQKAKEYGVQLSSESVAPTMVSDGMEHFKYVDVPMGEFWLNSPTHDKPTDMLDAISGAHVYGKNIVQAEGFTEVRGVIKALLDRNFALGMNRLFFHVNTHNPWLDRKPGMTLDGIGLFFQRDQTWFPEAKPFVDYITRCQTLLQKGRPVVDIAVYTGEEMPCRALTPDRLVPMLPGLFGAERVASENKRLANIGQTMEESPVGVRHSVGIVDLKDWINPLHGYQYDSMNKDALLNQPFNYKVLVIPQWVQLSPEAKKRIAQLRRQGVLIIDKPYKESAFEKVSPDVVLPEGIAYTHRTGEGEDIYFLANQTDQKQTFSPTFRESKGKAVVYNPLMDESYDYQGTITLPPYGSLFVSYQQSEYSHAGNKTFPRWEQNIPTLGINSEPWTVSFREAGLNIKTQQLFDWSQHEDDRIRYFSGHARYTTTWKLKKNEVPQGRAWLSFPNVKDIAYVWINGKDCGIAWTAPYEVEITGALKKGKNTIEIEVVNTWHNALRGLDAGKAPYDGIWTNAKYRTKGDSLLPAGLLESPMIITTTDRTE